MTDAQALGNLYMAIHINRLLYEQGKITDEMYEAAAQVFTERITGLEKDLKNTLNKTA